MAGMGHDCGMAKIRLSTTVDADLLARARAAHGPSTDASVVEAALEALLRLHQESEFDRVYAEAYARQQVGDRDEWGDLQAFLDGAARS